MTRVPVRARTADGGAMTATSSPPRPDPTRTGAVWVTGTGAFLLLAAAAVFTAMRWEQIPEAAKLGALGLATGACLIIGRGLKGTLPATAGALIHLGTFLVPLDVAAVGIRADLDWSTMLLAQGLAATITFGWAARTERSVVLRWAFAGAVVALAGGIGATTALPAPLVLAGFAAAAVVWRQDRLALPWAALAGAAPLLVFLDDVAGDGVGALGRLGLHGDEPRALALLTGLTAAATLTVIGRRRSDVGIVLLGAAVAAIGAFASWTEVAADRNFDLIGLAAAFLLVEGVAYALRHDPFWATPSRIIATIAELPARLGTVIMAFGAVAILAFDVATSEGAVASGLLGLAWMAADLRAGGRGRVASTLGMAVSMVAVVATTTGSITAVAISLVAVGAVASVVDRRAALFVAVTSVVAAPWLAATVSFTATAVGTGIVGSLVLADAAVRRSRASAPDAAGSDIAAQRAWVLSAAALLPGAIAMAAYLGDTGNTVAGLIGGAILATVVAAVADRGRVSGDLLLGTLPRIGAVAVLAGTSELAPTQIGLVALAVAGLSIADALRLRNPHVALGASLAVPVAIGALSRAAELSVPSSGVVLTISAAVLVGLGALVGQRWAVPLVAAAGIAAVAGLGLAASLPSAFADAVMVTSGIGLALAVERGRLDGVLLGSLTMTGGIWLRLADGEVTASEPYLLPVAVLLLGAGLRARSVGSSSWIAYGPVIALFGGAALAERLSGGPGWHGLVAGTVGVLAVAAGGHRRLAAPLLLGTGLLVALVGYETLAITAALPTWTWLAVGGTALLAAGIAMEHHDLGPVETGRRLVDVVDDHFA
ncbi:MAG: hypothetical protein ABIP36_02950 [Acidimicrobiales bacterium]